MHLLGFNSELFPYYINDEGNPLPYNDYFETSENNYYIKLPKVIQLAKTYFDCESIEHLKLENEGGTSSRFQHFEYTLF